MLSNHGKQYRNNIENMTNQRINDLKCELSDVSSSIFNVVSNFQNLVNVTTSFVDRNELSHVDNSDNIFTGEVFKDICNNYFYVNLKAVLKQFDINSNKIISLFNNNQNKHFFKEHNLSDLNTYDTIPITHNNKLYKLIKGTNIKSKQFNHEYEGKYVFSNKLIPSKYELTGKQNIIGNCFTSKLNKKIVFDKHFLNVSSPLQCKQLAIDNYYKHYILQHDTDGSLNCYLSNDINTTTDYDISLNGCNQSDKFKLGIIENSGLSVNKSYGIYTNKVSGSKTKYAQGGFIDFDSNFVNKNNQFETDNSNIYTIPHRTFKSLGNDVSCNTIINNSSLYGYVQNIHDNKCFSVDNNVILDPTQRLYDTNFNLIIKSKKKTSVIEPFTTHNVSSNKLKQYSEILIPTFQLGDILNNQLSEATINDINIQKKLIIHNSKNINKELEKYNKVIRLKNLQLSQDISLNMKFVTNYEDLKKDFNLENIDEIKRKLHDYQLVLGHKHHMYILWTIIGVSTLLILLKYSKPIK
jgi:hypothetical protein